MSDILYIGSQKDVPDAIGASFGTPGLLLLPENLAPAFFDLRSGIAGDLFQKFSNYRIKLAIVIEHEKDYGERFKELMWEHRKHSLIRFFSHRDEAQFWLETSD